VEGQSIQPGAEVNGAKSRHPIPDLQPGNSSGRARRHMGDIYVPSAVFQLDAELLRAPDVAVHDHCQVDGVRQAECQQETPPSDRRNRDINRAGTP
jgi:hypothetical protein